MYFLPTKKWPPSRLAWLVLSGLLFGTLLGYAYPETVRYHYPAIVITACLALIRAVYLYLFKD